MTLPALPPPSVPLTQPNGLMHPDWYRYFAALDKLARTI